MAHNPNGKREKRSGNLCENVENMALFICTLGQAKKSSTSSMLKNAPDSLLPVRCVCVVVVDVPPSLYVCVGFLYLAEQLLAKGQVLCLTCANPLRVYPEYEL